MPSWEPSPAQTGGLPTSQNGMAPPWSARSDREASFREDNFEQQRQQLSKPKLWRKLQVQKSTALGLVFPGANLQLEVRHVDKADQDLGLLYCTSKLHWEECFVTMLPKFDFYAINDDIISRSAKDREPMPFAKVSRPLWNCCRSTLATIKMSGVSESMQLDRELPLDVTKTWKLHQKGLKRHYYLVGSNNSKDIEPEAGGKTTYTWKGSKHVIQELEDYNPSCHGNLKLLDERGTVLAAWKQQRDSKVMGSIHIFEDARDAILIEVIVVSCLCIAIVEKTTGVTWFGGM